MARRLATVALTVVLAGCGLPATGAAPTPTGPPATPPASASPLPSGITRPYRPAPTPVPTFATYVVRTADTLIGLATRFGTTAESLAYWNRARYPSLDPDSPTYQPNRIEAGWTITYLPGVVVDPENLPPASQAATGEPDGNGVIGPFPALPANGGAALVQRGPAGQDGVALTFDYAGGAGVGPGGAEAVVQWLEVNGIPATVFVADTAAAPDDAAAAGVMARLARVQVVHTSLLESMSAPDGLADRLRSDDAAIRARLGATTAPFLRPADGIATAPALLEAGHAGWTWAVAWDVDPGDDVAPADGGPIAIDIVARVVSRASGGSIVRLHLGGARTLEALPGILEALASAGLRVVPLGAILGLE